MKALNGGELVIECLRRQGVRQIFSIVGGQMGTLYDAIGGAPDLDLFVPRNETAAPIMAAGYTAACGVPSVCMTTVGAGVVYEVAGLLKAWLDYLPVVSIAPQVQSYKTKPHQESLQSCNQDELFYPITKWNTIVYHFKRLPAMIDRGFREALTGIPGPVHLDVPVDILFKSEALSESKLERLLPPPPRTRYTGGVAGDEQQLRAAAAAICRAKRPLLLLGQGFGRAGRYPGVRQLLDRLGLPVLTTTCSSGALDGRSPGHAGSLSLFAGCEPGMELLKQADLLLIIGIDRYSRSLLGSLSEKHAERNLVQVEVEPGALLAGIDGLYPVYADPLAALTHFAREKERTKPDLDDWIEAVATAGDRIADEACRDLGPLAGAVEALSSSVTARHLMIADGERSCRSAAAVLRKSACRAPFLMDEGDFAGAGLPFAIGAALADPGKRVVLICDRDALIRHLRELQPAASAGLGLDVICLDDTGTENNAADLAMVLEALGCRTSPFDPDKTGGNELLEPCPGRPRAWIVRG